MTNSQSICYMFLDTNTLIHFQTFDEVDWCKFVDVNYVTLVFAPVVLRELDKFKNDSSNQWRQKRVRTVISKLEKFLFGDEKSKFGWEIKALNEPIVDWGSLGLDLNVNDDRLLASMLDFQIHKPHDHIVLVTDDILLTFKASTRSINCRDPRKLDINHLEPDHSEVQKLRQQLQVLRDKHPKLSLNILENDSKVSVIEREVRFGESPPDISQIIEENINAEKKYLDDELNYARLKQVDREERSIYERKFNEYLVLFEDELLKQYCRDFGHRLELQFLLENLGTTPATDIEIELEFGSSFFLIDLDDEEYYMGEFLAYRPEIPWNPSPFRTNLVSMPMSPFTPPPFRGPICEPEHRNVAIYSAEKLKHHQELLMDDLVVYIPPNITGGFNINYHIHADELHKPVQGKLTVRLKAEES